MNDYKILKGFRDFMPQEMMIRKEAIRRITKVFEKYGFDEIATPAVEYQELLLGKYGPEAEKLMYLFKDPGGRNVGLKYDLTVPLARAFSMNRSVPRPFKRYQIQPVWRAENTQKGRYREFYQCDCDIVGVSGPEADAEIIAVISDCMKELELPKATIRVNSRKVLFELMERAGIEQNLWLAAIQSIDKLDKKSPDEVHGELITRGIDENKASTLFKLIRETEPDDSLRNVISLAQKMGATDVQFDPTLARGLDYYTGVIFETVVKEPKIGSITGGGRYDNLLKTLGSEDAPCVGTTIGLERIIDVVTELNLWKNIPKTATKALVTVFSQELFTNSVELSKKLRSLGIETELYLESNAKLDKQLKYADRRGIPFVIVIGPEEVESGNVKIRSMENRNDTVVKVLEITASLFE